MQAQNNDNPEVFGERLRVARTQAGLTQVQLAERMQKGAATISDWEKGKSQPSLEEIRRLGTLLKMDAGFLAFGFSESLLGALRKLSNSDASGGTWKDSRSASGLSRMLRELELQFGTEGVAHMLGIGPDQVRKIIDGTANAPEGVARLVDQTYTEATTVLAGPVPESGTAATDPKENEVRRFVEALLRSANGDPDRLGWILVQLRSHLVAPSHWRTHDELNTAAATEAARMTAESNARLRHQVEDPELDDIRRRRAGA